MSAKKDAKGKMVQYKGSKIPNLYPAEFHKHINNLMEWYLLKLKPHSLHFFDQVSQAIKFEKDNGYNENPKTGEDIENKKKIKANSESITTVTMKHIHASFEAFNNFLKTSQNTVQNQA